MKLTMLANYFALFLLIGKSIAVPAPNQNQCEFNVDAAKQSAKAVSEFALKLYKKIIAAKPEENAVFSPVSIALGLALLESGAAGYTQKELQTLIGPAGNNQADTSRLYQSLQNQLQMQNEKTRVNIVNGLFYKDGLTMKSEFVNKSIKCFQTEITKAPFNTNIEAARSQINQWVSNETAQKIPELFKPGTLDPETAAVLANAIYFKAGWKSVFHQTEQLQFYKLGKTDNTQNVTFMVQSLERYFYTETDKLQVVEMPYQAAPYSMFIILPKQCDGIQAVENALTAEQLRTLITSTTERLVDLKVPKFTARSPIDLKTFLQQLGLNKIFSLQADLSRMSESNLRVAKAVHEAYIKVNEHGTEAAAATGIGAFPDSAIIGPNVPFVADHPFLFTIVHKPTNAVVFLGKINYVQQD